MVKTTNPTSKRVSRKAATRSSEQWQARFLRKLAHCGHVGEAAKYARVDRTTAYAHKQSDPDFAAQWDKALEVAVETVMEPEAWRRAIVGTDKGIYHNGELVATEKEYSNTLLIFMMKAHKPDKYRERIEIVVSAEQMKLLNAHGLKPSDAWLALMQQLAEAKQDANG